MPVKKAKAKRGDKGPEVAGWIREAVQQQACYSVIELLQTLPNVDAAKARKLLNNRHNNKLGTICEGRHPIRANGAKFVEFLNSGEFIY